MPTIHVFDYLDQPQKYPILPNCALFGDEPFLKRLALQRAVSQLTGDDDDANYATLQGDSVEWRDVMDELATRSLFGTHGPRLVVVRDADNFVSRYRSQLEKRASNEKPSGILMLDVTTWPSNTRLYKMLDKEGLQVECQPPQKAAGKRKVLDENRLRKWLVSWAKDQHAIRVTPGAADLLLELVGTELGLLDQDLAKLALFTEPKGEITPEMVRDIVGGWRAKTIWDLVDLATDGDAAAALQQLDRLIQSGENPIGLLAQMSWSLRRYATALRIFERSERSGQRIGLSEALLRAGFRRWPAEALIQAERQVRQLGRERAGQLLRWLLEADLALKGSHSTDERARFALELLLVRLSRKLSPTASSQ